MIDTLVIFIYVSIYVSSASTSASMSITPAIKMSIGHRSLLTYSTPVIWICNCCQNLHHFVIINVVNLPKKWIHYSSCLNLLQSFTCGIFPVQHSQNHSSYWSKARGNGSSSQDRTPVGRGKFSLPHFFGMGMCLQKVKVTIVTFMIVQKHVTIQCIAMWQKNQS